MLSQFLEKDKNETHAHAIKNSHHFHTVSMTKVLQEGGGGVKTHQEAPQNCHFPLYAIWIRKASKMEAKVHKMVPRLLKIGTDGLLINSEMGEQWRSRRETGIQNELPDASKASWNPEVEPRIKLGGVPAICIY